MSGPKGLMDQIYLYVHGQHHGQHLLMSSLALDGSMNLVKSPSASFLLLLLPLLPPLLQHSPVPLCVEAATSLFNGMSRKGSIVPACLKYRENLNNLLPLFKKLWRSCDSEGALSSLSVTPINSPWLLFSAATLFTPHWRDDKQVILWKDLVLLYLK